MKSLYHEVSKHVHGNTGLIALDEKQFTPGELVVLISFFRLRDEWGNALEWREVWKQREKL